MTAPHQPKPDHLATEYAAQFGDEEVAAAYRHRPPYPPATFRLIEPLLGPRPRDVLELGAGTGDLTIGLFPLVDTLVAVEPSRPMLERALAREGAIAEHVEWLAMTAEDYAFDRRYSAVVAGEAFHWFDWHRVLPRIAASLMAAGYLILVERALSGPLPWETDLRTLIREYSTNRDYEPYDTATELEERRLFSISGRAQTEAMPYRQPVEDYVESFHSRNGFSRARMQGARAREFDDELKALVGRHGDGDLVQLRVAARIVWVRPVAT